MYIKEEETLAYLHPDIAKEWHPTKNGNLTPDMFICGSNHRAWWRCSICQHEWRASIRQRAYIGSACLKCYRRRMREDNFNNICIYQYTENGDFVQKWKSITQAGDALDINSSNISMCALHKRPRAGGYRWEYEYFEKLSPIQPKVRKQRSGRTVIQIDDQGAIVNEYPSISAAAKAVGLDNSTICRVLKENTNRAGGFTWHYKDSPIPKDSEN